MKVSSKPKKLEVPKMQTNDRANTHFLSILRVHQTIQKIKRKPRQ